MPRVPDDADPQPHAQPDTRPDDQPGAPARRRFLVGAGGAMAAAPMALALPNAAAQPAPAAPAAAVAPAASAGYQFLGLDEVALTEALVDHMWPQDALGVGGTELGIATFIDRQLAGAYGAGDRLYLQGPFRTGKPQHGYQLAMTPASFYKAGCAALAAVCQARHKKDFDRLTSAEREALLQDVAAGRAQQGLPAGTVLLAEWFNSLVYPLFTQGAYSDPIYGGNRGKAAWKMIGYPGLPATYAQDVVRFRGKPHPGSASPKSIQDMS